MFYSIGANRGQLFYVYCTRGGHEDREETYLVIWR